MADELRHLAEMATVLLERLEAPQRTRLMKRLARDMRTAHQKRWAAQQAPDGTPWTPRKPRRRLKPATRAVRFVYRSKGMTRLVDMRSWVKQGDRMTGFDREAGGIRTFREDRIETWLSGQGPADPAGAPKGRGGTRRLAMFRGLRQTRNLKTGGSPDEAWLEFSARAQRLAGIHHWGLRDRVARDGPEVDYPARPLLGFSAADEAMVLDAFLDHAADALGWDRA